MTIDEVKAYINKHGNSQEVIDKLKEIMENGTTLAMISEEDLTKALNKKSITELDALLTSTQTTTLNEIPEISYETSTVRDISSKTTNNTAKTTNNISETPLTNKSINKHLFVWLCSFIGGTFGIDRFVRGKYGVLKLITLGGLGVWSFIDWIIAVFKAYGNEYGKKENFYFNKDGSYAIVKDKAKGLTWKPIVIIFVTLLFLLIVAPADTNKTTTEEGKPQTETVTEEDTEAEEETEANDKKDSEEDEEKSEAEQQIENLATARTKAVEFFATVNWNSVFKYKYKIHYIAQLEVGESANHEDLGKYVAIAPAEVQNGFGAISNGEIYVYMDEDFNITHVIYDSPDEPWQEISIE